MSTSEAAVAVMSQPAQRAVNSKESARFMVKLLARCQILAPGTRLMRPDMVKSAPHSCLSAFCLSVHDLRFGVHESREVQFRPARQPHDHAAGHATGFLP